MADIVGRGQVRLLLPYVRGTGGPPILVIRLRRPAFSTFRNDTSSTGPILEERKREDHHVCKWEAGARLTAARERHQYPRLSPIT